VSECLSCSELEQKICELSELIAAGGCDTTITKEGDTTIDRTPALNAKVKVLNGYIQMYKMKNCGSVSELYEFVHVPCVQPVDCSGSNCGPSIPSIRNQRRYRR